MLFYLSEYMPHKTVSKDCTSFLGGLFGAFDGLDFLEEEGPDDSGLYASSAEDASVGSGDGFVFFGEAFVGVGTELSDAVDAFAAVAAVVGGSGSVSSFGDILNDDFGACMEGGVPGVLTLRTLLDWVL
jgi:hypothetical protein